MINIKKIATHALRTWATALFLINPAQAGIPIEHWTQASGAQVYLVQSPGIPMLDVQIDFDAGSRRDPPDQAGLASVTASMTGKGVLATANKVAGGSTPEPALDENALSEAWADLGASFHASAGSDRMSFSLRSLSYPELLSQAVQLAARQLGEPAFPELIWQRERETLNAALKEANTRPATWADRAFGTAVYGQHPYGYEMTEDTLARVKVADMSSLHGRLILPCRAKVTLVGAVNRAQAEALVTQLLARLPAANVPCPALPNVPEVAALQEPVVKQMPFDSAQAHVLIGQPGFKRHDPDYFALTVGNYSLGGGGFVSRLTNEVREKRGLSYSVYSYFAPGLHAGAFTLGLQTRPDQAEQAVQVAREVLSRFVADGPTEAELQAAKDNLVGGFALRIDSNAKLLGNVANIAWHGLALDYLETWTQQVGQVTVQDIKAAFKRKLQPNTMVTVVVGGANAKP
ncbi:MAG: insulinase family protein [Gammaproteobacteria bacterium]|uniref:M16 family metallopeptidase n=1 Tax=Rhodoferax sp. TaxID=50421 RepID=UPI0017ADFC76|nr:pitrilysin family protein [Rhodoferax sp.]MBU3898625.1 insulinase family protein [Gammaproteobacteria bacterium]MBA3057451.1 insulinase family protein [Rhodoferax sp.]MBU3997728.1 insulinase family protein [Gammaproteobacteria bacterium]MBU4019534.1 insulinase family protein [Gammaproteobacteria bacterium]MBU4079048.1 insulinase family protein [Gammaproteobacteria bacterium]